MDIWIQVINTKLESEEFEFEGIFLGGKIVLQKDFFDENDASTSSGWLLHAYFRPIEFKDRPFIADICFRYGTRRREIMSIFVENDTFLGHVTSREKKGRIIIAARLRKFLCGVDLKQPSSSRNFIVQNFDAKLKESVLYYVSTIKLSFIGGDLFKKWHAQHEIGVLTVNEAFETSAIETLLDSTAKYDDIVIMRHTVDRLILLARKFRMHKLMRAIEDYIVSTKLLSWDEKMLLALQYRMSPLYVQIQKQYLMSPWTTLCRVQRLLLSHYVKNGAEEVSNPYEQLHKHFLELIMLSDQNICIG
ncbi:unnamed protein product [Caenorhabditis bovis]|uniref:BTB domain-containing protein n=1 Tax=Caenorhabditis bovis TaxID=2654633 RepID=A0A8S1EVY5_9PELO|nr:unnamed protein product [Caenorhabditis bovis]